MLSKWCYKKRQQVQGETMAEKEWGKRNEWGCHPLLQGVSVLDAATMGRKRIAFSPTLKSASEGCCHLYRLAHPCELLNWSWLHRVHHSKKASTSSIISAHAHILLRLIKLCFHRDRETGQNISHWSTSVCDWEHVVKHTNAPSSYKNRRTGYRFNVPFSWILWSKLLDTCDTTKAMGSLLHSGDSQDLAMQGKEAKQHGVAVHKSYMCR